MSFRLKRSAAAQIRHRCLAGVMVALCTWMVLLFSHGEPSAAAFSTAAASPPKNNLVSSRRGPLAAAVIAGLVAPQLAAPPLPAFAQQAWQLQLPRTWRTLSQEQPPPPGVKKPAALVVAGEPEIGGEMVVLRVPLSTDPQDPNAAASRDLIGYFSTPPGKNPPVQQQKVVNAVVQSQKTAPGLTKFDLTGSPMEAVKGSRRYVYYDYESSICQGRVTQGSSKSLCERPENGEELPLLNRHHAITLTVVNEAGQGNFLWLLDVSGPVENWSKATEAATTIKNSFELGSEEQLEKDRTVELTKEQLEALQKMKEAGKLPMDS